MEGEFLYKYRSLSDVNKERVERIFTHNELYFPSPIQFNDPFDCRIDLSFEGTDDEWNAYIDRLIANHRQELSPSKKLLLKKRLRRSNKLRNIDSEALLKLNHELGIFSMSSIPDDILMWSHYADSHQGICIGFNAGYNDHFFRVSQKVIYQKDYPSTRVHDSDMDRMTATLLTKSDHWKYEQEYRIIDYQNGPGIKKFPSKMLAIVILGCQISDENRKIVKNWVRNHPNSPTLLETHKKDRTFALDIV